jgi:glycosyltransferase involved in cell wall biosynthesis
MSNPYTSHSVKEELWGIIQILRKKPEIIFFPYADFNYHFFSYTKPFIRGRRILYSYFNVDELSNRFKSIDHFRRSELILVTSEEAKEYLDFKFKSKGPKVSLFPLGVNTDYFKPAPKKSPSEKRILISGSNRRDIQTIMLLVNFFEEKHPEIIFEMVGIPRLKSFAEGRRNVVFHDYLDDESFIQPYLRAEIAILPLESAASSNSLNEFISSCLPIVFTDLPGMSDLDLKRFGVGVPCGDVHGFIKVTEQLIFDDERILSFKKNCMSDRTALSWTSKVDRFKEICQM